MYTFVEFIAALEGKDFNVIEPDWLDWAKKYITSDIANLTHDGDCTNQSHTCQLCALEIYLKQYTDYTFNKEEFLKTII